MKVLEPLIKTECRRCNIVAEARLQLSGPHVKQLCDNCGSYIKFISPALVPSIKDIRQRIWDTSGNTDEIEEVKNSLHFDDMLERMKTTTQLQVLWWQVYLELRNTIKKPIKKVSR